MKHHARVPACSVSLIRLLGSGHQAVVLENLALRQQLAIYKRKQRRLRLMQRDRLFWMALARLWQGWRGALFVVHPDTVVRWQRERFECIGLGCRIVRSQADRQSAARFGN